MKAAEKFIGAFIAALKSSQTDGFPIRIHEIGLERFLANNGDGVARRIGIGRLDKESRPCRAFRSDAGLDNAGGFVAVDNLHVVAHGDVRYA